MNENSAPSPYGISDSFYRSCWDIIGNNVVDAVKEFFIIGEIFRNTNSNLMVIFSMNEAADTLDNFRPFVLGNFSLKLSQRLPRIV